MGQPFQNDRSRARLLSRLQSDGVSERVISAMMMVDREKFVPPALRQYAWSDESLPIGDGQTISQPSLVARMIDELRVQPDQKVLDVGTGSGYQAAILSLLAMEVVSVERIPALCLAASRTLHGLGYSNVKVFDAGDDLGWPCLAPYDGIVVGAASPQVAEALIEQLAIGGRLVIPVGNRELQDLTLVERTGQGAITKKLEPVRFVPLIGEGAWTH